MPSRSARRWRERSRGNRQEWRSSPLQRDQFVTRAEPERSRRPCCSRAARCSMCARSSAAVARDGPCAAASRRRRRSPLERSEIPDRSRRLDGSHVDPVTRDRRRTAPASASRSRDDRQCRRRAARTPPSPAGTTSSSRVAQGTAIVVVRRPWILGSARAIPRVASDPDTWARGRAAPAHATSRRPGRAASSASTCRARRARRQSRREAAGITTSCCRPGHRQGVVGVNRDRLTTPLMPQQTTPDREREDQNRGNRTTVTTEPERRPAAATASRA